MDKGKNIQELEVWGARELMQAGFSRAMAYQLLNRTDIPSVRIGGRVFVHRALFQEWLKRQAEKAD